MGRDAQRITSAALVRLKEPAQGNESLVISAYGDCHAAQRIVDGLLVREVSEFGFSA